MVKSNFKQAVNELMGNKTAGTVEEQVIFDDGENSQVEDEQVEIVDDKKNKKNQKWMSSEIPVDKVEESVAEVPTVAVAMETTVIAKGTSIVGKISTNGHVDMFGSVKGDIEAGGNVKVCGKIIGDVKGQKIDLVACSVKGNLTAASTLNIDSDSIVVGDAAASELNMDGKLRGNVKVDNAASFQKNTLVDGNVTAAVVSMNEGAELRGAIEILRSEKGQDVDKFFPDFDIE